MFVDWPGLIDNSFQASIQGRAKGYPKDIQTGDRHSVCGVRHLAVWLGCALMMASEWKKKKGLTAVAGGQPGGVLDQ
jgi:hypothetical protein